MHVISYRRLREYAEKHANIGDALDSWYIDRSTADRLGELFHIDSSLFV
jgi:mRNA interferase HigB